MCLGMETFFDKHLLIPYRTASKPYQYAAPILMVVILVECILVATQRPMSPGSLPSIWIHCVMLVALGYFAYLSWRQSDDLTKVEVQSNRTVRSFSIFLLLVPVFFDFILDVWTEFM
jgi:hypothetical protein